MVNKLVFCLLFVFLSSRQTKAQELAADQFGSDYKKAEQWLQTTASHWDQMALEGYNIPLAKAIIFPELLRYNQLRDKLELFGLQVLYIQFGKDYADFSIGPFQMKPSFAELIEQSGKNVSNNTTRKDRIDLLNTTAGQFIYLRRFLQWMDKTYAGKPWHSMEEKIRFYATAYNAGFNRPEKYLTAMLKRKYFRITEMSTDTFNYATIAFWYYQTRETSANNQFVYLYGNNPFTP